ncbi:MAG TPA: ATPase, partial [Planktothrix sp. UBA10369]|nr:ATPase [Planktothrix sp. UBA10369]
TNFRSTFERLDISLSQSSQNICNVGNSQCNFGSQILYNSTQNNQEDSANTKSKSVYHDLTLAPQ